MPKRKAMRIANDAASDLDENGEVKRCAGSGPGTVHSLPHEVLLVIFNKMTLVERCRMAGVCRRWRDIVYDASYWHSVDLSNEPTSLKRLGQLAKHHCLHAHTESIRLRGYLDKRYSLLALKHSLPHTLSKFVCGKLTASCVHLRDIEFNFIDVSSIAITDLPSRLERLALISCEIPVDWFDKCHLSSLTCLDTSGSSRVCTQHLSDLLANKCTRTMRHLTLSKCYRIDDSSIQLLASSDCRLLASLVSLNLDETSITPLGIQLLCTSSFASSLVYLSVRSCPKLTNTSYKAIVDAYLHATNKSLQFTAS